QQQLIDEFLRGYYGAAAPYLKEYLQLMETSYLTQNRKLSASNAQFSFVTLEVANRATQLFQEAANAVQGEKVLSERFRWSRSSLDVAILYRYRGLVQSAAAAGLEFLGPRDPNAAMQYYIATAQRFGVRNWGEGM